MPEQPVITGTSDPTNLEISGDPNVPEEPTVPPPVVQYAFVDGEGDIVTIYSDDNVTAYEFYDGLQAIPLSFEPSNDFMDTHWYNANSGLFIVRPARPNYFNNWVGQAWVVDTDKVYNSVRSTRDYKLSKSDWTQLPDAPLTGAKKAEWSIYRQSLRDIPQNQPNLAHPDSVAWPTEPSQ